jgi:hypothetical protein
MDNSAPDAMVEAEPRLVTVLVWVDRALDQVGLVTLEVGEDYAEVTGEAAIQGLPSARQVLSIAAAEPKVDLTRGKLYEGQADA